MITGLSRRLMPWIHFQAMQADSICLGLPVCSQSILTSAWIALQQAFLCTPYKNSRAPKLKKMEIPEKTQTQEKISIFWHFLGQKEKKTVKKSAWLTSNVLRFQCVMKKNCQFPQKTLTENFKLKTHKLTCFFTKFSLNSRNKLKTQEKNSKLKEKTQCLGGLPLSWPPKWC